jgi:hypothetical protein
MDFIIPAYCGTVHEINMKLTRGYFHTVHWSLHLFHVTVTAALQDIQLWINRNSSHSLHDAQFLVDCGSIEMVPITDAQFLVNCEMVPINWYLCSSYLNMTQLPISWCPVPSQLRSIEMVTIWFPFTDTQFPVNWAQLKWFLLADAQFLFEYGPIAH